MGKTHERSLAASVSWNLLSEAIGLNPAAATVLPNSKSASSSVVALPADVSVPWLPAGWIEDTTCSLGDIVSFILWIRDPMYRTATASVRRTMEMEEAAALLHGIDAAWKEHKNRGWIRKHLEEDLRERASGAVAAPDAWETARALKRAALLVDYVCIMRGVRIALWWPELKSMTVFPLTGGGTANIFGINCTTGHGLVSPNGASGISPSFLQPLLLSERVHAADIVWTMPQSAPSIGATTVAAITEQIQTLLPGTTPTGNRSSLWSRLQWLRFTADIGNTGS